MSHRIRTLLASFALALLSAFLALPTTGCGAVVAALPAVVAAIVDAGQILDAIERYVGQYFAARPDAAKQAEVARQIEKTRSALNIALRTAQGAQDLNDEKIDAAFDDFKKAYIDLLALCRPYGVKETAIPSAMHLRATPNELIVPQPVAFRKGAH